jgi:hypothetical protein
MWRAMVAVVRWAWAFWVESLVMLPVSLACFALPFTWRPERPPIEDEDEEDDDKDRLLGGGKLIGWSPPRIYLRVLWLGACRRGERGGAGSRPGGEGPSHDRLGGATRRGEGADLPAHGEGSIPLQQRLRPKNKGPSEVL